MAGRRRNLDAMKPTAFTMTAVLLAISTSYGAALPAAPGKAVLQGEVVHEVQLADRWQPGAHWQRGPSDFTFDAGRGARTFGYETAPAPNYGYRPYRPRVAMPVPVRPRFTTGVPPAWTAQWYAYCARKYLSFDRRTGRYLTYGGERRMCR